MTDRNLKIAIGVIIVLVLIIGGYFTTTKYITPKYQEKLGEAQMEVIAQIVNLIQTEGQASFQIQNTTYVCLINNRQGGA
jgi:uncharacterized membrane protein|tara:strand:- start:478 stop:717 length:240 start_codon:yes stop_codon:yes gene_type:complete